MNIRDDYLNVKVDKQCRRLHYKRRFAPYIAADQAARPVTVIDGEVTVGRPDCRDPNGTVWHTNVTIVTALLISEGI